MAILGLLADFGPVAQLVLAGLFILCPVLIAYARSCTKYTTITGAPVVGKKWKYEPSWLTRYRFVTGGWEVAQEGWQKVREITWLSESDRNIDTLALSSIGTLSLRSSGRTATSPFCP